MHRVDAFGNSPGVCRKLTKGIGCLLGWRMGIRQKKTETRRKIIKGSRKACRESRWSYDGPRYNLGIGPSSDDAVGSRRKFTRRFAEGMGKLAGNAKGDRWEEDRRTCHKITESCQSMPELGLN
ncbi:hypothetical protein GW17_00061270 [Ensete ventricosum]|nr:hypothetical protein GW17_00061270 [Ensete ventricosum]